jgi:Ni,Fe-hydrogenase maturation factor
MEWLIILIIVIIALFALNRLLKALGALIKFAINLAFVLILVGLLISLIRPDVVKSISDFLPKDVSEIVERILATLREYL